MVPSVLTILLICRHLQHRQGKLIMLLVQCPCAASWRGVDGGTFHDTQNTAEKLIIGEKIMNPSCLWAVLWLVKFSREQNGHTQKEKKGYLPNHRKVLKYGSL